MNDRAVLTLALVGTWAVGGFVYYVNRSFAAEQMQTLLLPFAVCIVALLSLARDARVHVPLGNGSRAEPLRRQLAFFPIALLAALGLMSILQSPNPITTTKNLRAGHNSFYSTLIPMRAIRTAEGFVRIHGGGSIGYFGGNGSYVHLLTGLPNPLLYDDPSQLDYSDSLHDVGCRYLEAHATTWLIIWRGDINSTGPDTCGSYHAVRVAGLPPRTLFARTGR